MQNTEQTQLSTRHSLSKIDKSQYTKAEWVVLREQRRRKKVLNNQPVKSKKSKKYPPASTTYETVPFEHIESKPITETKKYIVTLKVGNKYSAEYVNRLYDQCMQNTTIDVEFACLTEDPSGLNKSIIVIPLETQSNIQGWWYKPFIFNKEFPLKGTLLFLDLDVIVFENIDKLFKYKPGSFCVIRDFTRHQVSTWKKFNSSIVRMETGQKDSVYSKFIDSPATIIKRFRGDQDWLFAEVTKDFEYWPDEWIQSYKWEMRGNPKLVWKNDHKDFEHIAEPLIKQNTCIAVFHGDPKPELCLDPWVRKYWK